MVMGLPTNEEPEEPFNPHEFIKKHIRVRSWINERQIPYTKNELKTLITLVTELFKMEKSLIRMGPPITVIGDLHGQFRDLVRILFSGGDKEMLKRKEMFPISSRRYMFLGDYVDRGQHSLECISLVFALKLVLPKQYGLLRGNHETRSINCAYGFKEECILKLGPKDGMEIWELFNEAFSWMPLAGLIGEKVLCMHGGISDALHSFEDIENIKRPLMEVTNTKLPLDLLWSDPILTFGDDPKPAFRSNMVRGLSCEFNEAAVHRVCAELRLDRIIRAHQVKQHGFEFFAKEKMLTIFSAPNYMAEQENLGAIIRIKTDGNMAVCQLRAKGKAREKPQLEEETRGIEPVALKRVKSSSCPVIESEEENVEADKKRKK